MTDSQRLSAHGLAVLAACAASPLRLRDANCDPGGAGGAMRFSELVRLVPGRPTVARASLSRTLRRLHRHGLIELASATGYALTARHTHAVADLQAAERDPEGTFARAKAEAADAAARGCGGLFFWQSPAEYVDYVRRHARERVRHQPMAFVQITRAGRERLTARRREDTTFPSEQLTSSPRCGVNRKVQESPG